MFLHSVVELTRNIWEPMMAKRRSRKLLEADRFQARVISLMRVPHDDWNEWEQDWLQDEAQRPNDYLYSDKERVILNQLIACSTTFTQYNGCSVQEMLNIAYPYRKDYDEDDEAFLEQLHDWRARDLKVRQISRLASLYRLTDPLQRADMVDDVMRVTRTQNSSEQLGNDSYESNRYA
jgi:hypothetical protein